MPKIKGISAFALQIGLYLSVLIWMTVIVAEPVPGRSSLSDADDDSPLSEDYWFSPPKVWNFRRHVTRAVAASECWPRVKFGLLKSSAGCPNGAWKSGSVRHLLRSTSSVSSQNYLKADIASDSVTLHFCMRDTEPSENLEEFDCLHVVNEPTFPPGSYCLFNGQRPNVYERCPAGFYWSAVGVDDVGHDGNRQYGADRRDIPTGEFFPTFSHYYFCCRNDSSPSEPVTLPIAQSFILLPLNSERKCQEITGVKARMFSLFLDTEGESYFGHPDKQSAPYAATEVVIEGGGSCSGDRYGKGLKLHLCYYSKS